MTIHTTPSAATSATVAADAQASYFRGHVELQVYEPAPGRPSLIDGPDWAEVERLDVTDQDPDTPPECRAYVVRALTAVLARGPVAAERQIEARMAAFATRHPRRVIGGAVLEVAPVEQIRRVR